MSFVHRHMSTAAAILLVMAALTGSSAPATAADVDGDRARNVDTATMAAARRVAPVPPAAAAPASRAAVPTVRSIEAESAITGSEPDPESFDAKGLELWWQHYQQAPKKAE